MCDPATLIAAFSAFSSTATAIVAATDKPKDPAKLQAEADAKAARSANARLAARSKSLAANSLLTGAPTSGKDTFGG